MEACVARKHLKKSGFEDHQKHLLRSCSPEADVIRGSEDHQELKDWKLQICVKCCFNQAYHCRRIEAEAMANSEEFGRHWMLILWRMLEKDNSTKCTTTISTTQFCVCNRTRTTTVTTLLFFYTWNGFEIVPS